LLAPSGAALGSSSSLARPATSDDRGQLIAVADSAGQLQGTLSGPEYNAGLWSSSGLTSHSQSFNPRHWATPGGIDTISTFRSRQYDPATGKWLQEDPIGVAGGVNLYQYNGNDPNSFSDPFGTCEHPPCISADDPLHGKGLPDNVNPDDLTWDSGIGGYRHDKSGKLYVPDPEDEAHWRHWDVITPRGPNGEHSQERYPKKAFKPGHGPRDQRSPIDPFGLGTMRFDLDLGRLLGPIETSIDWLTKLLKHIGPPFAVPNVPGFGIPRLIGTPP
jgi:RHS repeat-associated protein